MIADEIEWLLARQQKKKKAKKKPRTFSKGACFTEVQLHLKGFSTLN